MIKVALHRAYNLHFYKMDIDKSARQFLNDHKSTVIWFTGI
jgi:adenylylsulfate kinase-like enzyme